MKRKDFLQTCALTCLSLPAFGLVLQGCGSAKTVTGNLNGSDIVVPISEFEIRSEGAVQYRKYLVVRNKILRHPLCVYRLSANEYSALLMRCTHKGAELEANEQRLSCPVHGSEFDVYGIVQNSPASANLRVFPVRIENNNLNISLK